MLATTYTGSVAGVEGLLIGVEVALAKGINSSRIMGLSDTAVREAEVRLRSAMKNSGFSIWTP